MATKNARFKFFFTHDKNFIKKINRMRFRPAPPNKDSFIIIRDASLITDFDPLAGGIDDFSSDYDL